jgi:hypothetical protein
LVLVLPERRRAELNSTAVLIVNLSDDQHTLEQAALKVSKHHDISQDINHDISVGYIL